METRAEKKRKLMKDVKELEEIYDYPKPQYGQYKPTTFIVACEDGAVDDVKVLIAGYEAAGRNKRELLEEFGFNSEASYYSQVNPLMAAAGGFNHEVVKYLIGERVNISARDPVWDRNVLHFLCNQIPYILNDKYKLTTSEKRRRLDDAAITMTILLKHMSDKDINYEAGNGQWHPFTPLDTMMGWQTRSLTYKDDPRTEDREKIMKPFIDMLIRAGARRSKYTQKEIAARAARAAGGGKGGGKSSLRF